MTTSAAWSAERGGAARLRAADGGTLRLRGAVLCFDASRLARNGRDSHHLLELCGLMAMAASTRHENQPSGSQFGLAEELQTTQR